MPENEHKVFALYRKVSRLITPLIAMTSLTPNQITLFRFLAFIPLAMYLFSLGEYVATLVALIFYHLFKLFDVVDGEIARLKSMATSFGHWFDDSIDFIGGCFVLMSIVLGVVESNYNFHFFSFYVIKISKSTTFAVGLSVLFAQFMCTHFSKELEHKFKLFNDRTRIEDEFELYGHTSKCDRLIKNIVFIPSVPWQIFFAYGYLITFGGLLNQQFIALLVVAITNNIRWVLLFYTFFRASRKST